MAEARLDGLNPGVDAWFVVDENVTPLQMTRTADGFRWLLPARVRIDANGALDRMVGSPRPPRAQVANVSARVSLVSRSGAALEMGTARDLGPNGMGLPDGETHLRLELTGSRSALAAWERHRDGAEPQFDVLVFASICLVHQSSDSFAIATAALGVHGGLRFQIAKPTWLAALKALGAAYNGLIEIPFAADSPPGWEGVWKAVEEARTAFDSGGPVGWAGCASRCRQALDEWERVRGASVGTGDREDRTLPERVDAVRIAIRQATHLSVHGFAEHWTRTDALLILTTLMALLSRETN